MWLLNSLGQGLSSPRTCLIELTSHAAICNAPVSHAQGIRTIVRYRTFRAESDRRDVALNGRVVHTIPSHDVVLRRVVDRVTVEARARTPEELAERLRPLYPQIAVFEGQLSGDRPYLYVYRDGRYEPESGEAWWAATNAAWVRVSVRTGKVVAASASWASLMRADLHSLPGRDYPDFIPPAAQAVEKAMFEALRDEEEVHSRALAVRQDGTTLSIEFRAIRLNGDVDVFYRPLAGETGDGPS